MGIQKEISKASKERLSKARERKPPVLLMSESAPQRASSPAAKKGAKVAEKAVKIDKSAGIAKKSPAKSGDKSSKTKGDSAPKGTVKKVGLDSKASPSKTAAKLPKVTKPAKTKSPAKEQPKAKSVTKEEPKAAKAHSNETKPATKEVKSTAKDSKSKAKPAAKVDSAKSSKSPAKHPKSPAKGEKSPSKSSKSSNSKQSPSKGTPKSKASPKSSKDAKTAKSPAKEEKAAPAKQDKAAPKSPKGVSKGTKEKAAPKSAKAASPATSKKSHKASATKSPIKKAAPKSASKKAATPPKKAGGKSEKASPAKASKPKASPAKRTPQPSKSPEPKTSGRKRPASSAAPAAKAAKAARTSAKTTTTTTVANHIAARTEVDLTGYSYGEAPAEGTGGKLDLVFCLDCTGSMSGVIASCQASIGSMVEALTSAEGQDVRLCLIPYRDHSTSEEFCTKVYPFTRDVAQMQSNVNAQKAQGGGDTPEAVTAAMFEALCLDWRGDAAKLVVFMADAGPHGLGEGFAFPNGDPDGKDPLAIAREMHGLGVSVYSVLSGGSDKTKHFFAALAAMTGGQCVQLADAALLSEAILGGAREGLDMEARMAVVRTRLADAAAKKGSALTEEEAEAETRAAVEEAEAAAGGARKPRPLPEDKVVAIPAERLEQARTAATIVDLRNLWDGSASSAGAPAAALSGEVGMLRRMASMAAAREARPKGKVLIEIVKEGKKLRARVASAGYDGSKNCQFPRDIREEGKRFWAEEVVNVGTFYRVKGKIEPAEEEEEEEEEEPAAAAAAAGTTAAEAEPPAAEAGEVAAADAPAAADPVAAAEPAAAAPAEGSEDKPAEEASAAAEAEAAAPAEAAEAVAAEGGDEAAASGEGSVAAGGEAEAAAA